jgi:hypothetical protein|eukprot:COSAG01_NODE_4905_length_4639_cov_14.340088_2_plen_47_part_00
MAPTTVMMIAALCYPLSVLSAVRVPPLASCVSCYCPTARSVCVGPQ